MPKGKSPTVSEAIARPTRTSIMYGVAVGLVVFYNGHIDHLDKQGKAVALGVALAAVNAVWVAVENRLGVGLLRNVPPKRAKVVDTDDTDPYPPPYGPADKALLQGAQAAGRAPVGSWADSGLTLPPGAAWTVRPVEPATVRLHPDDLAQLAALIAARGTTPRKAPAKRPAPPAR